MLTLSINKADAGGFAGHSAVHPDLLTRARQAIADAVASDLLVDGTVATCGVQGARRSAPAVTSALVRRCRPDGPGRAEA